MSILVGLFAAIAAAALVVTIAQTAAVYPALPSRVPSGLDLHGVARGYWPRPMIWLTVAIQAAVLAMMLVTGPGRGSALGMSIIAVCVSALIWRVQNLLLSAARSAGRPVPMRGFWMFFGAWLLVVLVDAFTIG